VILYQVGSRGVDSANFLIFTDFSLFFMKISSNIFFAGTPCPNKLKFYRNVPWVLLYQVFSKGADSANFLISKEFSLFCNHF
jgi:hypothetical protein